MNAPEYIVLFKAMIALGGRTATGVMFGENDGAAALILELQRRIFLGCRIYRF